MGNYERIKDLHAERRTFFFRALVVMLVCGVLVMLLVARLANLQVTQHEYFTTRSNDNRMRLVVVPPVRGLIYDRNGAVLAQNIPSYVLEIVPEQVRDLDDTIRRLQPLVTLTETDLDRFRDRLRRTPRYRGVPLRTRLSMEEVARLQINRHDFPGVDIRAGLTRNYPLGPSAAHVIGYVAGVTERDLQEFGAQAYRGTTHIGRIGVERSHERSLHGAVGAKIVETNAAGRPLRDLEYRRGAPGRNLFLTIDAQLQLVAEQALGDREGAVVAIEPRTGELLALVSKPGFDPHLFVEGINHASFRELNEDLTRPLFNRALAGQYPPGSTIKPFIGLAGLEHGQITPHESMFCPGHFQLPNYSRLFRDWKRRGHGWMDFTRAIAESCDVYFYRLAHDLGIDHIETFLAQFGLGQATGLDLPGERSGLLPSRDWKRRVRREAWFPGETLNIGIGQGYMMMTPVQLAHATARIAMRGEGFVPHVVHAEEDPVTGHVTGTAPEPLPPVSLRDSRFWDRVIESMIAATHSPGGTALRIGRDAPYRIASKTGTAQVAGLSQEDDKAPLLEDVPKHLRDHALFVAFAPVDEPRIAIAVIAEHSGSGGAVAAPVARQIMDAWLLRDDPLQPAGAAP